ncbi:MAG: hypothetical protein ACKV19_02840 [Verrucomicrobiales bacterium]
MKLYRIRIICSSLALALAAITVIQGAEPRQRSIQEVYNEGRAAFFRDDLATAKRLLTQVNKADPKHRPTIILLKNIQLAEREAAIKANSLENRMRKVVIPRFELVDARVPEVLEFLQIKAAEASKDGVKPNFLIQLNQQDDKRLVTLRLSQPSLHSALAALATLADLEVRYDMYAVTIRSRSLVPSTPEPAAAKSAAATESKK